MNTDFRVFIFLFLLEFGFSADFLCLEMATKDFVCISSITQLTKTTHTNLTWMCVKCHRYYVTYKYGTAAELQKTKPKI